MSLWVRITFAILMAVNHVTCDDVGVDSHWCHDHHEHFESMDAVKEYMNLTTPGLTIADLGDVISHVFLRVECDKAQMATECDTCLTAANVYSVLNLDPSEEMDTAHFQEASAIITTFLYQLPVMCNWTASADWESLTYADFTAILLAFHDHDHEDHVIATVQDEDEDENEHVDEHFFTSHQLEFLMREINETYRPGEVKFGGDGDVVDPDIARVCSQQDQETFRSRDVLEDTDTHAPEEGVAEEELGDMASNLLARLLRGDCMERDRKEDDGLPDEENFMESLFTAFAENDTCILGRKGYETILSSLGIGESSATDDGHEDHNHAVSRRKRMSESRMRNRRSTRATEEDGDHDHEGEGTVSQTCYSGDDILSTLYMDTVSVKITQDDFLRLCPVLLQQATEGCLYVDEHADGASPTNAETYGYGSVAVLIISGCAAFGLVLGSGARGQSFKYLISCMLGLAVGSLIGDTFLHLIPQCLGLHSHSGDTHDHSAEQGIAVEPYVWKMMACCGAIWCYIVLQMVLQYHGTEESDIDSTSQKSDDNSYLDGKVNPAFTPDFTEKGYAANGKLTRYEVKPEVEKASACNQSLDAHAESSVAWMVIIGDLIHNVADGLAIGAAFTQDWRTGVATSIAIFCHELPHEFGDVAILLSAGWSVKKTALFQMVSAFSAFIGLYIGIPVAQTVAAREWIFAVAAGMFIYVALSDVIPEILELFRGRGPWKVFAAAHGGICLGFLAMTLIAVFEEHITVG